MTGAVPEVKIRCVDTSSKPLADPRGRQGRAPPGVQVQGGHGTGKTGNLDLTFSRQGKHREFCFDTGKNSETHGKYFSVTGKNLDTGKIFDCDY